MKECQVQSDVPLFDPRIIIEVLKSFVELGDVIYFIHYFLVLMITESFSW